MEYDIDKLIEMNEKDIQELFNKYGISLSEEDMECIKAYRLTKEIFPKTASNILEVLKPKIQELNQKTTLDEDKKNTVKKEMLKEIKRIAKRFYLLNDFDINAIFGDIYGGEYDEINKHYDLMNEDDIQEFISSGEIYDIELFMHDLLGNIEECYKKDITFEELERRYKKIKELETRYDEHIKIENKRIALGETEYKINEKIPDFNPAEILPIDKAQEVLEVINGIENPINEEKKTITGFIIFAAPTDGEPYVLEDITEVKKKAPNDIGVWQRNLGKLIEDIHKMGMPEQLKVTNTSATNSNDTLMNKLFYTNGNGKVDRNNSNWTGMWIVKPTTSSSVRYIETEIKLQPQSETYNQIIDILEQYMNINIDREKEFKLSICYGLGYRDTTDYNKIIRRKDKVRSTYGMLEGGYLIYDQIEKIIKRSLEVYARLDPNEYDLSFISSCIKKGDNKRGRR